MFLFSGYNSFFYSRIEKFFRQFKDPKEEGKLIEIEFIDIYPASLIIKVKFRISNKGGGKKGIGL